jgi:hypothetical protein
LCQREEKRNKNTYTCKYISRKKSVLKTGLNQVLCPVCSVTTKIKQNKTSKTKVPAAWARKILTGDQNAEFTGLKILSCVYLSRQLQ